MNIINITNGPKITLPIVCPGKGMLEHKSRVSYRAIVLSSAVITQ